MLTLKLVTVRSLITNFMAFYTNVTSYVSKKKGRKVPYHGAIAVIFGSDTPLSQLKYAEECICRADGVHVDTIVGHESRDIIVGKVNLKCKFTHLVPVGAKGSNLVFDDADEEFLPSLLIQDFTKKFVSAFEAQDEVPEYRIVIVKDLSMIGDEPESWAYDIEFDE